MQNSQASQLKLLLIEDEEDLADQLQRFLTKRGFSVQVSYNIKDSLALISQQTFDGVLFDRLLPDGDALSVVAEIKQHHQGLLLIMSALGQVKDRIAGFTQDVDYYLPKPVNLDELQALLERYARLQGLSKQKAQHNAQHRESQLEWAMDANRLISPAGEAVILTSREAIMMGLFLENKGKLVSKASLINALNKNYDTYDLKALDSAIYRIRHKAEVALQVSLPLETAHGLGYVWQG